MDSNALSRAPDGPQGAGGGDAAFHFVQALAGELTSGATHELPGYPAAVARLQKLLQDENLELARLVEVIRCEPVIAGQILRIANSAALNTLGVPISDLRNAIARVGLNAVRAAIISFGMDQLREAPEFKGLEARLEQLWQRNVQLASVSQAIARRFTHLNAEAAMLAGLLQGIGKLYILARAGKHRALFADEQAYRSIEQTWNVSIATAVIESWNIAPEIIDAVRDSEDLLREARGAPTLSDVLAVATLLTDFAGGGDELREKVEAARPCQRLHLDYDSCVAFMRSSEQEVAALREALTV